MIINNIKLALRQIKTQKVYALLNIAGLAISMASCLLIAIYIKSELSHDRHYEKANQMYRVYQDIKMKSAELMNSVTAGPLANVLKDEVSEVVRAGKINPYYFNAGANLVKTENAKENSYQEGFAYVDQSFSEMFEFEKIEGNAKGWLVEPYSIVLTESKAKQFFPNGGAIGKRLIMNDRPEDQGYTVTGVIKDISPNVHFDHRYFMSISTIGADEDNWLFNNYYTYVELAEGTSQANTEKKMDRIASKYIAPALKEQMNINIQSESVNGEHYRLKLFPVKDIHLKSHADFLSLGPVGDMRYVKMFGAIAIFLLLIAIVNFVNLSTARSANRAKEVGTRKVLGASKGELIGQFLVEAILLSAMALAIGLLLAELALPIFNKLAERSLEIPYANFLFLPGMGLAAIAIGMLSGLYPAFYLTRFSPINVLKGKLSKGSRSGLLRKGLVVFQFTVSVGLIIGTLVVNAQLKFIQNKKLGFDKEQILLVEDAYMLRDQVEVFKSALNRLPEVEYVSLTAFLPFEGGDRSSFPINAEGKNDGADKVHIQGWTVDEDYIPALKMNIVEGRNFDDARATDSLSVILNQTTVQKLGFGNDALGKKVLSPFSDDLYTVIGVIEDFNYENLKNEVSPLVLFYGTNPDVIAIKSNTDDLNRLIAKTEATWKEFRPGQIFRYSFLNERFDKMYQSENRSGTIFQVFAILAIFIACLGLFGLATFTANQRTKEIGIRKVLGASVPSVVGLLSKEFLRLVLIALVIATPLAYYFMNNWLNDFVYRVDLQWWMFVLAGVLAVLIAFLTVSYQSIRAALMNPIKALRSE